jgi:multidrug efflux pump
LIYLVLAAQFESWIDPFVIMFTVPLSLVGAVIASEIHGADAQRVQPDRHHHVGGARDEERHPHRRVRKPAKAQGLSVYEAARQAAISRFRPILMTSLSTILGITPIAIALGGAAESRRSLGIAVIGGMLIATLLTPAVYSLLSREIRPEDAEAQTHEEESSNPDPVPAGRH